MQNLSTWLLVMFMGMFWVFRMIVAFTTEIGMDFGGITALNVEVEIALLFVALICMVLVIRRSLFGAIIYLIAYGSYFGVYLYNNISLLFTGETFSIEIATNLLISIIGTVIPIAILLDILLDKNRKAHPKDKKTDWFYQNEKFDRKLDDRADKNNYRTL